MIQILLKIKNLSIKYSKNILVCKYVFINLNYRMESSNISLWHSFFITVIITFIILAWRQRSEDSLKFELSDTTNLNYDYDNNDYKNNEKNVINNLDDNESDVLKDYDYDTNNESIKTDYEAFKNLGIEENFLLGK